MLPLTRLVVRLAPGRVQPLPDLPVFDRILGGPVVLLEWLETQLGLPQADVHRAARVMQYADALAKVPEACFERSLAADRWETASELLQRRDELMLCGWDGVDSQGCPRIAVDLALAEKEYVGSFPSEAERVAAVEEALNAGQVSPRHELKLAEPIELWPAAWQTGTTRDTHTLSHSDRLAKIFQTKGTVGEGEVSPCVHCLPCRSPLMERNVAGPQA